MNRTFEIINQPEQVKTILSSLRKDDHLSKTFEGTAENGLLTGFYTNLALVNGMVIGYVKIKGHYNIDQGNLNLQVVPSRLYWVAMLFNITCLTLLSYQGFAGDRGALIGSFLFGFMALANTIIYLLGRRSFLKHIGRVSRINGSFTKKLE